VRRKKLLLEKRNHWNISDPHDDLAIALSFIDPGGFKKLRM
jgi:hypothetical protein